MQPVTVTRQNKQQQYGIIGGTQPCGRLFATSGCVYKVKPHLRRRQNPDRITDQITDRITDRITDGIKKNQGKKKNNEWLCPMVLNKVLFNYVLISLQSENFQANVNIKWNLP